MANYFCSIVQMTNKSLVSLLENSLYKSEAKDHEPNKSRSTVCNWQFQNKEKETANKYMGEDIQLLSSPKGALHFLFIYLEHSL